MTGRGLAFAAAVITAASASARERDFGVTRYLLLETDLSAEVVDVARFWRQTEAGAQGELVYFGADGASRSMPPSRIAALLPADWDGGTMPESIAAREALRPGMFHGVLELVDGQRFIGELAGHAPDAPPPAPTDVAWEHPEFGRIVVDLDAVRFIRLSSETPPAAGGPPAPRAGAAAARPEAKKSEGDVVILLNGDRVTGLVESIGAIVAIDSETGRLTIPARQVARVSLENPARAGAGARAWLRDGSIVGVSGLITEGSDGRVTLELRPRAGAKAAPARPSAAEAESEDRAAAASLDPGAILALTPDVGRLVSLASLPVQSQRPGPGRRLADPVAALWQGAPVGRDEMGAIPLSAADLLLPGPMAVEWDLPAGAARLAGRAELPPECLVWGDCIVRIGTVTGLGGAGEFTELAGARLSAERPALDFNVAFDGASGARRLRIEVDAGEHGPIMDRVLLRRALIRVR
jgi:hypothetical protein